MEAELTPMMVEVDLMLGHGTMVVLELDADAVEPSVAAAGILADLDVPMRVVIGSFAGVAASMRVDEESVFVVAVPMGPGFAAVVSTGLEFDPRLVAFAAGLAVLESVPNVAESVFPLEDGSRMAGFESSKYFSGLEVGLGPEGGEVFPMEVGVVIDLLLVPDVELDAKNS